MQLILVVGTFVFAISGALIGWNKGAAFEVRGFLITFFSLLIALRYLHPLVSLLSGIDLGLPVGFVAAFVGIVLLVVGRILVANILGNKAKALKPAADNVPDKGIGALAGFSSGLIIGSTLALLVTLGLQISAMKAGGKQVADFPVWLYRFVERDLFHVPDDARTLLPVVRPDGANPDRNTLTWE